MKRALLWITLSGTGILSAPMALAQDADIHVELFALAHFPLLREVDNMRYPTGPTEYRLFSYWVMDKWQDRSPENFDLVAIIKNRGELPVGPIELRLTGDRKIGEFLDYDNLSQPRPHELAQWEGPKLLETRTVGALDGNSIKSVWFGPLSTDELWRPLWALDLWPWEARYEVTLVCDGCSPMTASASFTMAHPH